jgi:hypothetical protein
MRELVELGWRAYPSAALMAGGIGLVMYGLRGGYLSWRLGVNHPEKSLRWMLGFRQVMIGLAVVGIGAAWWWQLGWLLALALIVGGEETLESSICIFALREQRHGRNRFGSTGRTASRKQLGRGESPYVRGVEGAR